MNPRFVGSPYAKDYPGIPPVKTTGNSRVISGYSEIPELDVDWHLNGVYNSRSGCIPGDRD
jgi:hypothetical protein